MLSLYCFDLRLRSTLKNLYRPSRMYFEVVADNEKDALDHASEIFHIRSKTLFSTELTCVSRRVKPIPGGSALGPLPRADKTEARDWDWKSTR